MRMITFSLLPPPINLFPLISWCTAAAAKQAQTDPTSLPPFLRYLSFFSFIWRDSRTPPPSPSRARSVCPSVDLGAHSLHHSFTSTRETIHRERPRGRWLRPPLILACIIKQVPQSQTAAAHCTADDGDGDVTDGVRIAVYRILRNQSWMSSPLCGGDVGVKQDSGSLARMRWHAELVTLRCYIFSPCLLMDKDCTYLSRECVPHFIHTEHADLSEHAC